MVESNRQNDLLDQEELVAYLDGELEPDAVRQVEDRLTIDAQYRSLLQKLERSWDLLDDLPRGTSDERFTQTTMEMVAIKAAEDVQEETDTVKAKGTGRTFIAILAGAAVGITGFWGLGYWLDRENRALVEDLAVIERVDIYDKIDDVDFLLMLDKEDLFSRGVSDEP